MNADSIYRLYGNSTNLLTNLGLWKIHETLKIYDQAKSYMQITFNEANLQFKQNIQSQMAFQLTAAENWPVLTEGDGLSYWQQALEINKQIFGAKHYQFARYSFMLAQALECNNQIEQAKKYYNQALMILKSQNIKHPNIEQFYISNIRKIEERLQRLN